MTLFCCLFPCLHLFQVLVKFDFYVWNIRRGEVKKQRGKSSKTLTYVSEHGIIYFIHISLLYVSSLHYEGEVFWRIGVVRN